MYKMIIKMSLVASIVVYGANAEELKKTLQINDDNLSSYTDYKIGDSKIYFMGNDSATFGNELWVSNGTESGTYMVGDFNEGVSDSYFNFVDTLGDRLIFTKNSSYLMSSDGTFSTTKFVSDIDSDTNETRKVVVHNYYNPIKKIGSTVLYQRTDVDNIGVELWKTDGTTTSLVKDINIGTGSSYPDDFNEINGKILFTARDGIHGDEIWVSDGTTAGTFLLKDVQAGGNDTGYTFFGTYNGELYFYTSYSVYEDNIYKSVNQLWKSDGTVDGTKVVFESNKENRDVRLSTTKSKFTVTKNGKIFFMASYNEYDELNSDWKNKGEELWVSDGTTGGTAVIKDFQLGSTGSSFENLKTIGEKIVFRNYNDSNYHLWVSDGTIDGTKELTDKDGNSIYSYYYYNDQYISDELNGKIYFYGKLEANDAYGYELYATDGTVNGTYMLKDIAPGSASSSPQYFHLFNNKVYFKAYTPNYGDELWVSDGTKLGTQMVHDIWYGGNYSNLEIIGTMGGELYLKAQDQTNYKYNIWATDGEVTIDEDRLLDVNVTAAIEATKLGCKNNPASCGIYTVAPTLTTNILASKSLGWHIVGTSTPIDNMSVFNGVDTVWKWDGTKWLVYSPEPAMQSLIKDAGFQTINQLDSFDGVWIRKK